MTQQHTDRKEPNKYRPLPSQGTALPLQADFLDAYDLKVVALPPHRPRQREDHPPEVYMGTEV